MLGYSTKKFSILFGFKHTKETVLSRPVSCPTKFNINSTKHKQQICSCCCCAKSHVAQVILVAWLSFVTFFWSLPCKLELTSLHSPSLNDITLVVVNVLPREKDETRHKSDVLIGI